MGRFEQRGAKPEVGEGDVSLHSGRAGGEDRVHLVRPAEVALDKRQRDVNGAQVALLQPQREFARGDAGGLQAKGPAGIFFASVQRFPGNGGRLGHAQQDGVAGAGGELAGESGSEQNLVPAGRGAGEALELPETLVYTVDRYAGGTAAGGFVRSDGLQNDERAGGAAWRRELLAEETGTGDRRIGIAQPGQYKVAQAAADRIAHQRGAAKHRDRRGNTQQNGQVGAPVPGQATRQQGGGLHGATHSGGGIEGGQAETGYLTARNGRLTMTAPGVDLPLAASRPKVYWAVGNCLTGVVNTSRNSFKDSYALAWMKNGARQYVGAVQSTWYELNWNMADWFLKQEGRWTFSESLFLLRQWSQYLLAENIVTGRDREGTEFTDGIFVLYGDPALEARVEKAREPALTETLDIQETGDKDVVRMTYKVKVNFVGEGNKRTAEKYDGWRIFCYLLPYQVTEAKVEKTDFAKVVLPGETIIWDAGKGLKVGDERSVTFTARRVRD